MKWQDRQGSINLEDRRRTLVDDPLYDLIIQTNATLDQLEALKNYNPDRPIPVMRRIGPDGSWMNNALKSAQEFGTQFQPTGDVPLPEPRPRRYTNAQD